MKKVQRVTILSIYPNLPNPGIKPKHLFEPDSNGTHYLAPISDFVVVARNDWDFARSALAEILEVEQKRTPHLGMIRESGIEKGCIVCLAHFALRALATTDEIRQMTDSCSVDRLCSP
jgi:hypothetical protein